VGFVALLHCTDSFSVSRRTACQSPCCADVSIDNAKADNDDSFVAATGEDDSGDGAAATEDRRRRAKSADASWRLPKVVPRTVFNEWFKLYSFEMNY
jgi:hypothetical protein